MKTICFIETDETGEIQWSEGCICANNEYPYSIELVDRKAAEEKIKQLEKRISDLSWSLYPEQMGR